MSGKDDYWEKKAESLMLMLEELQEKWHSKHEVLQERNQKLQERLSYYISENFECNECGTSDNWDEYHGPCEMCAKTKKYLKEIEEFENGHR